MKALFPRRDGLPPAALLIALLALPQAAETIPAPALPDLARHWRLDAALTQSVMGIYFPASPPACCCGLAVRRLGPAAGAAGRPVHGTGGHPVRRLGARIRGAAGRALRPGAGAGHLLHHHADHAARPPAGRGADPLLHHAGRRAVLVAGAGPLAGQLLADQAGFAACWAASRRWPACCWRPDGRRSAKRGRPRQRASPCSGWRAACCATPSCCARPCWWPA